MDNSDPEGFLPRYKVVGDISVAAFKNETAAMRKALFSTWHSGDRLVPNPEDLRVGDILLTRQVDQSGRAKKSPIYGAQREAGFPHIQAYWCHVSLYVGDLHVLEAQGVKDRLWAGEFFRGSNGFRVGVQLRPIGTYTNRHMFIVLRHKNAAFDKERMGVARYGLLDMSVHRRRYGHFRALEGRNSLALANLKKPKLKNTVICSELVLECLAFGARVFVKEFEDLALGRTFFFPAHFAGMSDLKIVEVGLLKLTR